MLIAGLAVGENLIRLNSWPAFLHYKHLLPAVSYAEHQQYSDAASNGRPTAGYIAVAGEVFWRRWRILSS